MKTKTIPGFSIFSAAIGVLSTALTCSADPLYPVDGYTVRYDPTYFLGLVGGPDIAPLSFLSINPYVGAGDKVVLIFDVSRAQLSSVPEYLNFFLGSLDYPNFDTIHIDAFDAPVLRDPSYYFDTSDEVATFSTYNPSPTEPPFPSFKESVDVTSAVNDAITDGDTYLGFELYGTLGDGSSRLSRYSIFGGYPPDLFIGRLPFVYTPPPPPPVPDSGNCGMIIAASALVIFIFRRYSNSGEERP